MRERANELWLRLKTIFRRRQLERDLEDELAFHLAMHEQSCREAGAHENDSSYAARRQFGNTARLKETCRELWSFASVEAFLADLRHAARGLRKSRGFTVIAVLSLALGIGANLAIFSVVRGILLEPLPVKYPQRLVILGWSRQDRGGGLYQFNSGDYVEEKTGRLYNSNFPYFVYRAVRQQAAGHGDVFAFASVREVHVSMGGQPMVATALMASGNYFSGLGVSAILGRTLVESDDRPEAEPAVVISHAFWMRAFGADPAVLGKQIKVNGSPFTIVGITPREFYGVSRGGFSPPTDLTVPLAAQPAVAASWSPVRSSIFQAENYWWLRLMARVPSEASAKSLEAALSVAFRQCLAGSSVPALQRAVSPEIHALPGARGIESLRRNIERPLRILTMVVGLVLLIACVNLANLMLARGLARQKEISVRLALGSGRMRLVRQVLAESLLLSFTGGALGVLLAGWGSRALLAMLAGGAGRTAIDLSPDWPLIGVAAGVSLAAGILFGLLPALRLARTDLAPVLKQTPHGSGAPRLSFSRVLMVAQVGISLVLLAGAAMFLRTLENLGRVDIGFNPRGLVVFHIDPTLNGYDRAKTNRVYRQVVERLAGVPGVASVTLMSDRLLTGWKSGTTISVEGAEPKPVHTNNVGPAFFETFGIPVIAGRGIGIQDDSQTASVAVVNESAARAFFGGGLPIGRRFRRSGWGKTWEVEVVGVARDTRYESLRNEVPPTIFVPYLQGGGLGSMNVAIRTAIDPSGVVAAIRAAVAEVDRDVPVTDLKTQVQQIQETLGQENVFTRLLVFFGFFALLLASIGLHGMMSYSVARRTGEIGIRMALGARRPQVLWMVLRQVLALACAGLAIGIPASMAAAKLVRTMLFGIQPGDPLSLAAAALVMCAVALAAGYVPARRASRLDPLVALRYE